ncbi:MAG: hypothetical protein AB8B80_16510 [Marinicellaceae bacterium]
MKIELKPDRSLAFYKKKKHFTSLYLTSVVTGLCIAIYFFVFDIEVYSNFMLIRGTLLWFIPVIFGYFGLIAQWLHANFVERSFRTPQDLFVSQSKQLPVVIRPFLNAVHIPLFIPNKTPIFIAIAGSFIWAIWIMIFFVIIFPILV